MARSPQTKTLQVAAKLLGGPRKLRDVLGAPSASIVAWLAGNEEPPPAVFLRALQVVLDHMDARDGDARDGRPPKK